VTGAAPRVAVFRPNDERIDDAVDRLSSLGAIPVPDPMLAVEPTGVTPSAAPVVVFTSKTGVELAVDAGFDPDDATLAVIGPATAAAAREAGWTVDVVPEEYTSAGLVAALRDASAASASKSPGPTTAATCSSRGSGRPARHRRRPCCTD
jgi:Uroporphyrinogen-III synthase